MLLPAGPQSLFIDGQGPAKTHTANLIVSLSRFVLSFWWFPATLRQCPPSVAAALEAPRPPPSPAAGPRLAERCPGPGRALLSGPHKLTATPASLANQPLWVLTLPPSQSSLPRALNLPTPMLLNS